MGPPNGLTDNLRHTKMGGQNYTPGSSINSSVTGALAERITAPIGVDLETKFGMIETHGLVLLRRANTHGVLQC